ncbi:MAG: hypothetical protein V4580_16405 [Bacteroidota bacterium]
MKFTFLISLLLLSFLVNSQSNFSIKISADEIEQPFAWHYVMSLDDGSSVLLTTDKLRSKFYMKRFDQEARMVLDTLFWESLDTEKNHVQISGVHEINGRLIFFLSKLIKATVTFYRLEIDPKNGKKIREEELFNYSITDQEFPGNSDYTFDFTKNDVTKRYYFLVLVKAKKDNIELLLNSYNYDHQKVSSTAKQVPIKSSSIDLLSSLQIGNDYYFAINYNNVVDKTEKIYKKDIIIYKGSANKLEEVPFLAENFSNIIGGQFSNGQNGVKLAISNSYITTETFFGDRKTDTYLLTLNDEIFGITEKQNILHDKLISQYKNISKIKEKGRIHILNSPAAYFVNYANQDEMIFHSYSGGANGNTQWTYIDDLGIFDFDSKGNLIKTDIHPLKYELTEHCTNTFQYNLWHKGNTFQYNAGHPSALLFKHIEFINYNGKTFVFYNDAPENIGVTDIKDATELKKINQSIGMCLVSNKDGNTKKTVGIVKEQLYFDFASAGFNEKTGIYSVITYAKKNKVFISHITLQ